MNLEDLKSFRAPEHVKIISELLAQVVHDPLNIMQVCGTHTLNYHKYGLPHLMPEKLRLFAGPGCPICVTHQKDIDWVISLIKENKKSIIATFGDLMQVPGTCGKSLSQLKDEGFDIRIILSPIQALNLASSEAPKRVIFIAIGFETTAPAVALIIQDAMKLRLTNFSVVLLLKNLINALPYLLRKAQISGLLCPGHVAAVIGSKAFEPIVESLGVPCAIAGFEPVDILMGLLNLAYQNSQGLVRLYNVYPRVVVKNGNSKAKELIHSTFDMNNAIWRGFSFIPKTGYQLKKAFGNFEIKPDEFRLRNTHIRQLDCICDEVILGKAAPTSCPLFNNPCKPEAPIGPCMVSREGTCRAYYLHL